MIKGLCVVWHAKDFFWFIITYQKTLEVPSRLVAEHDAISRLAAEHDSRIQLPDPDPDPDLILGEGDEADSEGGEGRALGRGW